MSEATPDGALVITRQNLFNYVVFAALLFIVGGAAYRYGKDGSYDVPSVQRPALPAFHSRCSRNCECGGRLGDLGTGQTEPTPQVQVQTKQ